jgi:hypothetical protein
LNTSFAGISNFDYIFPHLQVCIPGFQGQSMKKRFHGFGEEYGKVKENAEGKAMGRIFGIIR